MRGEKKAATETLYFDVVTDTATRIAGVQSGQYDIAEEIPADNYEELSKDKNLEMSVERGGTLNLFLNNNRRNHGRCQYATAVLAALNCEDILLASLWKSRPL